MLHARHPVATGPRADLGGKELPSLQVRRRDAEIAQFIRNHADSIYHPVGSCVRAPGPAGRGGMRSCACMARRGCGWWTPPSCPASSRYTNAPTVMVAEPGGGLAVRQRRLRFWAVSAAKAPSRQRQCQPQKATTVVAASTTAAQRLGPLHP